MSTTLKTWRLTNGLTVTADDETINYYGDYHNVRLVVRCSVAVQKEYLASFEKGNHYERASAMLGPVAEYRREIVKAGVPGKDLPKVKENLLRSFEETALPYFERDVFAERFVQKRFTEIDEGIAKENRFDGRNGD
jgi:hypothetical protein